MLESPNLHSLLFLFLPLGEIERSVGTIFSTASRAGGKEEGGMGLKLARKVLCVYPY